MNRETWISNSGMAVAEPDSYLFAIYHLAFKLFIQGPCLIHMWFEFSKIPSQSAVLALPMRMQPKFDRLETTALRELRILGQIHALAQSLAWCFTYDNRNEVEYGERNDARLAATEIDLD